MLRTNLSTRPFYNVRAGASRAAHQHASETLTGQTVLVVHRRLVHEVGERVALPFSFVAEEDHVAAAHDGDRRVVGADLHHQPVAGRHAAAGQIAVHDAEGGQIHQAGVQSCALACRFVFPNDVLTRQRDHELVAAFNRL